MIKQTLGLALLCLSLPLPCAGAEQLRVAHNNRLPPFAELKEGKTVGLVVDIFRTAAERSGYTVEFVPVPLEQMESALRDGRATASIPTAITPERRERLDFSDTLLMTGGAIYVRAPDPTPENLQSLNGKTVVTPGTGPLAAFMPTGPGIASTTAGWDGSVAEAIIISADGRLPGILPLP